MSRNPNRLVPGSLLTTSVATYYTVPANTLTTISACTVNNTSAGALTFTLHLVPPGTTATAANQIVTTRALSAGEAYNVVGTIGQTMLAGGTIQALASAGGGISLIASGYEATLT